MRNSSATENYKYNIDTKTIEDGKVLYYCRDTNDYPLLLEITANEVDLYYYYDRETNHFLKAERLKIIWQFE